MIDMETVKPLDRAFNFTTDNFFEYIQQMLSDVNADLIGSQATETLDNLIRYIQTLAVNDADSVIFNVEDMANTALNQTSSYAYRAGFTEACRLLKTLHSF